MYRESLRDQHFLIIMCRSSGYLIPEAGIYLVALLSLRLDLRDSIFMRTLRGIRDQKCDIEPRGFWLHVPACVACVRSSVRTFLCETEPYLKKGY